MNVGELIRGTRVQRFGAESHPVWMMPAHRWIATLFLWMSRYSENAVER